MQDRPPLERVLDLVKDLRVRCAWDRAQTRETLRPYLVEEVLELDHALREEDPDAIREELGDFLLHLAWQFVIAEERGEATPDEIADRVVRKMERRHPHLFNLGPREPWEQLKRKEGRRGLLEGLPPTLPDLLMAYRLQERAASVGFDWPDVGGPLNKVREELGEVEEELSVGQDGHEALADEIGDLLLPWSTSRARPGFSRAPRSTAPTPSSAGVLPRSSGWRERRGSTCTLRAGGAGRIVGRSEEVRVRVMRVRGNI
jgi:MazG family protein